MADDLDDLIAGYRARIAEAAKHNTSVADGLLRELAAILEARLLVASLTAATAAAAAPGPRKFGISYAAAKSGHEETP